MDARGLHNLSKPNEWAAIEDLLVFGAITNPSNGETAHLDPRLQHHCATIHLPDLTEADLETITSQMIHALTPLPGEPAINSTPTLASSSHLTPKALQDVHTASLEVYRSVKKVLQVSGMPGRWHYFFDLTQLESVFQVCTLSSSSLTQLCCSGNIMLTGVREWASDWHTVKHGLFVARLQSLTALSWM